tara:strand:+ start:268 stop:939 length:672 start_codon:yes stop_codon:yes gene_type:complete
MLPATCLGVPAIVYDNFYAEPDAARKYALSLKYDDTEGIYPGVRTKPNAVAERINKITLDLLTSRISELFVKQPTIESVRNQFQKIPNFSADKDNPLNWGWIHRDSVEPNPVPPSLAGIVYLDPNPTSNTGTSFYESKIEPVSWEGDDIRLQLCQDKLTNKFKYIDSIKKHNSQFEKVMEVENKYNRLVIYNGSDYHAMTSCYTKYDNIRLTQVLFYNFPDIY